MVTTTCNRRLRAFHLFFFLLAICGFIFLSSYESTSVILLGKPRAWENPFITDDGLLWWNDGIPSKDSPLRISIVESAGVHDEVTAALVYAFGGHKNAELRLYFARQRYHSDMIINGLNLEAPILSVNHSNTFQVDVQELPPPHFVVSTTCELDLEKQEEVVDPLRHLLFNTTTHLFCLVHHAELWAKGKNVDAVREWVDQSRVDFIGLSQHTVNFLLKESIPQWQGLKADVTARTFPPVFPVNQTDDNSSEISLALQGDYSSARRDYGRIFEHLSSVVRKVNETPAVTASGADERVMLHLIGHGEHVHVPENVQSHVTFDEDLTYSNFYQLLSRSYAVIPAFASETYLDRKASSTVPASVIAGAPLIASEELLSAYSYLPRDAVWLSQPGEGEMATVERVVSNRKEYIRKRGRVRAACTEIMRQNRANIRNWMEEDLAKIVTRHQLSR